MLIDDTDSTLIEKVPSQFSQYSGKSFEQESQQRNFGGEKYNNLLNYQFQDANTYSVKELYSQSPDSSMDFSAEQQTKVNTQVKRRSSAEISIPMDTSGTFRRDQTFRAKEELSGTDVVNGIASSLEKYNWNRGYDTLAPSQNMDWDKSSKDKRIGKFVICFQEDTQVTNAVINVCTHEGENGKEIWVEFSNLSGDRDTYDTFLNFIRKELEETVLEEFVCSEYYSPISSGDDDIDFYDDSSDVDEDMSDSERAEVKAAVQQRMNDWMSERYYHAMANGMDQLCTLANQYPDIMAELWDVKFEKALTKEYRKCGDLPLALSMLIFMERIVANNGHDADGRTSRFVDQINARSKLFSAVFQSKSQWSENGRFQNSWIMLNQIYKTLGVFVDNGMKKVLGGGRNIPARHYEDMMKKTGEKHQTFSAHLARLCNYRPDYSNANTINALSPASQS